MARGETRFFLEVEVGAAGGAEAVESYRVAATALCLERPQDLPIETIARPDPEFLARLGRVREELQRLVVELEPHHRADPDWDGSFSRALRDELQQRISPVLERHGVLERIESASREGTGELVSCVAELIPVLQGGAGAVSPEDEWKLMVDICPGDGPDVRSRIVYHLTAPGVDPDRRAAMLRLMDAPGFTDCLVRIIEVDPEAAEAVLHLAAGASYREAAAVRARVAALWAAEGIPQAVEELRTIGGHGPALDRLLRRCASLQRDALGAPGAARDAGGEDP